MGDMRLGGMEIRYSQFVPKLYNYCLSLGFQRRRMMPSRAFCSDESQGYPVILMAQHFGTFPFDHGTVGGRVATDRNGPHAHHGEDLVIVHASHVGYDSERRQFGVYQRSRTTDAEFGANCGKLSGVLQWYQHEYQRASQDIRLGTVSGKPAVFIDNALLNPNRTEGLFPNLERFVDQAQPAPLLILSTSKAFAAAPSLRRMLSEADWPDTAKPIGDLLAEDMFFFRRQPVVGPEGLDLLEEAIAPAMPTLVTSPAPALDAARYLTQIEFDRAWRAIQREPAYHDKNVLFVSGLNVDVSPRHGMLFPLTKFVPWAAGARMRNGTYLVLEQLELFETLGSQTADNADQISFDGAIETMARAETIELPDA
jgi:hypothetical protein